MKFTKGDVLSFNCGNGNFLAGLIVLTENGAYYVVLTNYCKKLPAQESDIRDSQVFGILYSMGEQSISALDAVQLAPAKIDSEPDITLIMHFDIQGILSTAGLVPIDYSAANLFDCFKKGIESRQNPDFDSGAMAFESKIFIPLMEFLSAVPLPNELPTVKLYKSVDGEVHYFQIYGNSQEPLSLVIHNGKLGETGEFTETLDKPLASLKETYAQSILSKREEGYAEWANTSAMILQFPTSDEWGATDDLDYRNDVSDYLNKYLFWTGNGSTTGGDIGSGTINIFFETVDPVVVVPMIVQVLAQKPVDRPFIIALESYPESTDLTDGEAFVKVVYPEDYKQEFFY